MDIPRLIQEYAEQLDDMEISDLAEGGVSSTQLRDIAGMLVDVADCIDFYRDRPNYTGKPRLRLVRLNK